MQFSPDTPITAARQDKLGRTRFTHAVAEALGNWREDQSLVVALFGGWGSGKTSIKNLATAKLRKLSPDKRPLIVEFNPWFVAGEEQLVELFYREIALAIAEPFPGERAEDAEKRLKKLAAYLSVCGTAAHHALDVVSLFVPGAGLFAKLAKGLGNVSDAVSKSQQAEKDIAEASKKSQPQLKASLRAALSGRKTPILIVIDDIDRLTTDEICLLFRLIKANADFPRFIYLILCDREFVTQALSNFAPNRGPEFLEKIVQVGFDVPPPLWSELAQMASSDWDRMLRMR
jgi:predicted KAP-like P-loop ATPase